jgi:long-chain acyl-CoA synthetase
MVTGAAPIAVETLDFLKVVLCCPILEAYGQTECTGGGFLTNMNDG